MAKNNFTFHLCFSFNDSSVDLIQYVAKNTLVWKLEVVMWSAKICEQRLRISGGTSMEDDVKVTQSVFFFFLTSTDEGRPMQSTINVLNCGKTTQRKPREVKTRHVSLVYIDSRYSKKLFIPNPFA